MAGISTSPSGVGLPIGLAGATAATRYVGGTASGAPVSGTFSLGDIVVDQLGNEFVCVTAGSPGTWTNATKSRDQLARTASGMLAESVPRRVSAASGVAPNTQIVFGALLGLHAGDVVTGILLNNLTAAAGTLPTTARFGIADATGKMLALSGNLNALANWGTGPLAFPFTAPYTVLADGGYFGCFVVNGTWSVTQPSLLSFASFAAAAVAFGSAAPTSFQWAAQTDLPAVNSSVTITGGGNTAFYMAFY